MVRLDQLLPCAPGAPPAPPWFKCSLSQASGHHSDGSNVIRARGAGAFFAGRGVAGADARRGTRGRTRVALDYRAGSPQRSGPRPRGQRISSQKARKHVTGTLFGLPDEHFCLPDERWASRELLSTHHHGARRRRRTTTTVRCRRRLTPAHPGDSPPHDHNETEGPVNTLRRVARVRRPRLPRLPASERGPLLPLPRDLRLGVIPLRHHDGLAAHGAARCDLGVSRLGPNGLKIKKETTHDLV